MAEMAVADALTDETRGELDGYRERYTRTSNASFAPLPSAVENEESEQREAVKKPATPRRGPTRHRGPASALELRGARFAWAATFSRQWRMRAVDGAELELNAAVRDRGQQIPIGNCSHRPQQRVDRTEDRATLRQRRCS